LKTPGNAGFKYPVIGGVKDQRKYSNQMKAEVFFNGHTSQVSTLTTGKSGFTSNLAKEHFGATAGPTTYEAQQFHFHSPSEHTFDGEYHDLEMHTVHHIKKGEENGFAAAALGIMFSVDKYTAKLDDKGKEVIDKFFKSL
jgi:carbonic anhydrase